MKKPDKVNILGVEYSIEYVDNPASVDRNKRKSLWGQIDYWTRSIRVFDDGKRPIEDVWQTILHEVLHGISSSLHLEKLDGDKGHEELDLIALALTDVLFRNGWLK